MRKKMLSVFVSFLLLTGIALLFNACTKNNINTPETSPVNHIQTAAVSILSDSLFTNLVSDFINESILVKENSGDTAIIALSNERLAIRIIQFATSQKEFSQLNSLDRYKVLHYIADSTKSKTYLLNNPDIQTNINNIRIMSNTSAYKSNGLSGHPVILKLTNEEIINCFIDTTINALGYYGEALSEIISLSRGGTTGGLLVKMGYDILKNASPWWKIGSIVLQFSNCLYREL